METRNQKVDDRHRGPDSPAGGEGPSRDGGPVAGRRAVTTDDPAVAPGAAPASEPKTHPDQTTVIETSGIRQPDDAANPRVLLVPVAQSEPQGRAGSGVSEADVSKGERGAGREEQTGQGGHPRKAPSSPPGRTPSLTRNLLYAGVVSLICGVAGAWGYSYFFGSSDSGDQKPSGKSSSPGGNSDSGKGSDSGEGSDSGNGAVISRKGQGQGDLAQAGAAWLAAVKELRQSQEAEKEARRSEEETDAVLDFLKRALLTGGRSGDGALAEAFWSGGRGKDVTLRQALDDTEPRVADAFADRPLGEASVREILGLGYLSVGEAPEAVKEFERALALREALQGAGRRETVACRNQLAVAYRLAGRADEASRLFDRGPDSPARASALAIRGAMLLHEKKPAEAELKLRQSLTIRQEVGPDDWTTFDTKSSLGEALLDQRKYVDAESLLVSGYEGMKEREDKIPSQDRPRLTKALERLVRLYDAWGKKDEAMRWRKELTSADQPPAGSS